MATGRTAEGTTWTTRPMSPAVAAKYACVHRGGVVPCAFEPEGDERCEPPKLNWRWIAWIAPEGARVKRYSPATPKPLAPSLPAAIGADFAAACTVARRRLDGLEPWPAVKSDKAPKLSELGRRLADAKWTKTYREFCAAVVAAGGALALPLGVSAPKPPARIRGRRRKLAVAA